MSKKTVSINQSTSHETISLGEGPSGNSKPKYRQSSSPVPGPSGNYKPKYRQSTSPDSGSSEIYKSKYRQSTSPDSEPSGNYKSKYCQSTSVPGPSGNYKSKYRQSTSPVPGPSGISKPKYRQSTSPDSGPLGSSKPKYRQSTSPVPGPSGNYKPKYRQSTRDSGSSGNRKPKYRQSTSPVPGPSGNYKPKYRRSTPDSGSSGNRKPKYRQLTSPDSGPSGSSKPKYRQSTSPVPGPSGNYKPKYRQSTLPDSTTSRDTNADIVSTSNEAVKQTLKPSELNTEEKHVAIEERVLQLPNLAVPSIKPDDVLFTLLNRYKATGNNTIESSELDTIQRNFEQMLTSVIERKRAIQDTLNQFSSFENEEVELINRPCKKKPAEKTPSINKCYKTLVVPDFPSNEKQSDLEENSENEFWSFVNSYIGRITKTDIEWLENSIKSYDCIDYLTEIPPLGEHYSNTRVEQEDQPSCSTSQASEKHQLSKRIMPDVVELLHNIDRTVQKGSVYTPVYQRVSAALLKHLQMSTEDSESSEGSEDSEGWEDSDSIPQEMEYAGKKFHAEQNIKEQLNNLGLLNRNDGNEKLPPSLADSDEILREIEHCDFVLAELRKQNKKDLTTILEKCRVDYDQQNINDQLKELDANILNYKREPNYHLTNDERHAQIDEENCNMQLLLNQRSNYLMKLKSGKSVLSDPEPED